MNNSENTKKEILEMITEKNQNLAKILIEKLILQAKIEYLEKK